MSIVLWANVLIDGRVESNQADHRLLYKHGKQLDTIARSLALRPFLDICDTTDQQVNLDILPLPPGMTSTDELMAVRGVWMPAADAVPWLQALHDHILQQGVRFGLLRNDQPGVLAELAEVIAFVASRSPAAQGFNFAIVS